MAQETTKGKSKGQTSSVPLQAHRAVGPDLRDPRCSGECWPCFGSHRPSKPASNGSAQWTECAVCALRLSYVPRQGAAAEFSKVHNPSNVKLAMQKVQQAVVPPALPTARLVKAMMEAVVAEEKATAELSKLRATPAQTQGVAQAQGSTQEKTEIVNTANLYEKATTIPVQPQAQGAESEEELMRERPSMSSSAKPKLNDALASLTPVEMEELAAFIAARKPQRMQTDAGSSSARSWEHVGAAAEEVDEPDAN